MDWFWITLGVVLTFTGLLGSILPVLPGPPLNYLALLLIHFTGYRTFSYSFLVSWFLITLAIVILDYLVPIYGAKKYGGSQAGIWGATTGLVLGIFFFPPFGMIILSFIGAVIGELLNGRSMNVAIRSGTGTFIGFLLGTLAKLIISIIMAVYFFKAVI